MITMNESQADLMLAAMGLLFCFIGLVIYAYSRLRYKQYRRHTQGVISHQYWKRYNEFQEIDGGILYFSSKEQNYYDDLEMFCTDSLDFVGFETDKYQVVDIY